MSFEFASALILSAVLYVLFTASLELGKEHWQLKMGLFYGALFLGWSVVNFALAMTSEVVGVASNLYKSVEIFYYAYSVIGILCISYLFIRMLNYILHFFLDLVRKRKEVRNAW